MKTPMPKLVFNKVSGPEPVFLLKIGVDTVFWREFNEICMNTFFIEQLRATASVIQVNERRSSNFVISAFYFSVLDFSLSFFFLYFFLLAKLFPILCSQLDVSKAISGTRSQIPTLHALP